MDSLVVRITSDSEKVTATDLDGKDVGPVHMVNQWSQRGIARFHVHLVINGFVFTGRYAENINNFCKVRRLSERTNVRTNYEKARLVD